MDPDFGTQAPTLISHNIKITILCSSFLCLQANSDLSKTWTSQDLWRCAMVHLWCGCEVGPTGWDQIKIWRIWWSIQHIELSLMFLKHIPEPFLQCGRTHFPAKIKITVSLNGCIWSVSILRWVCKWWNSHFPSWSLPEHHTEPLQLAFFPSLSYASGCFLQTRQLSSMTP